MQDSNGFASWSNKDPPRPVINISHFHSKDCRFRNRDDRQRACVPNHAQRPSIATMPFQTQSWSYGSGRDLLLSGDGNAVGRTAYIC